MKSDPALDKIGTGETAQVGDLPRTASIQGRRRDAGMDGGRTCVCSDIRASGYYPVPGTATTHPRK